MLFIVFFYICDEEERFYFDVLLFCLVKIEMKRVVGDCFLWEYCGEVCRIIIGGGMGGNFVGKKK